MNKVYGYVRVSTLSQSDNTSITHQKDTIKKWCDLYDLPLVEIVEEVVSGVGEDRDGIKYLMDKVENGECDKIVVYKIDRLVRSFRSGVNIIQDLIENDCKIVSCNEKIDTSSISGEFFLNVLLSLSQMEKMTISQRMNRGKKHKFIEDGKMVCSNPPFGYSKVGSDVVMDDNSKVVKLIFKLWNKWIEYPQHIRCRKITTYLNNKGYSFRGSKFISQHIKRIIRNPFYKGMMSFGKVGMSKHTYPTIVSSRIYNKCNGYNQI